MCYILGCTANKQFAISCVNLPGPQAKAASLGAGSNAQLVQKRVDSLAGLEQEAWSAGAGYHAVIVTAGAAVGSIAEIGSSVPLQICQVRYLRWHGSHIK